MADWLSSLPVCSRAHPLNHKQVRHALLPDKLNMLVLTGVPWRRGSWGLWRRGRVELAPRINLCRLIGKLELKRRQFRLFRVIGGADKVPNGVFPRQSAS